MPTIYLSPSTQEYNLFVTEGNEEYWMNQIVDAMIPYLQQFGISYYRNTPDMTAGSSIRDSNARNVDFHLAIHSNASVPGQEGRNRGVIAFYYPGSINGERMANILVENFRQIYPLPDLVRAVPITTLGEVSRTNAPSVLLEVAYHDNVEDANWITSNIDTIARTIAESVNQYFSGAQQEPGTGETGRVTTAGGYLNIRNGPALTGEIIGMAPNGAIVIITEQVGEWYRILYNGIDGYVFGEYITRL